MPDTLDNLFIDETQAFEIARRLNPEILQLRQKELEAARSLEQAVKDSRFNANLDMSYGLNQSSLTFDEVYINPLDQQMVGVSVSIPLLDWGNSKGRKKMAQSQKEVVDIEVEQALLDFEQQVRLKVIDFNLQGKVVASAARADELAMQSFQVTKKRFMLGKVDVLRLTTAMKNRQMARERYINSLATYWRYFYEVQEITLYDFVNGVSIEEDFEILINR
jgi:outer membrane protein TolC